ncbi:MAG: hypothetical protein ACJAV1_000089 [Paraglaciecola sp.]|jgi:hypothetical protein
MADDLSLKAKRLLAAQYNKILLDESAVANASDAMIEVLRWCNNLEFKPGKWVKPKKTYRFDREYITQINQTLLDEKYASIFDDFSQDTHRSAAQRNPYEKQGQLKPTQHLVLAAITGSPALDAINQRFYVSQQVNIELDVTQLQLKLDVFECLVVVENRDSFNDWFEYQSYTYLSNALVIYRGDKHHSTACKSLLKSWLNTQGNKPAIYFGDGDLAGLRIATSADYSHLLLPEFNWFEKNIIKQHYPDNQQKYLAKLHLDCPQGWKHLLILISDSRAGLRQQKMYQTSLKSYPRKALR